MGDEVEAEKDRLLEVVRPGSNLRCLICSFLQASVALCLIFRFVAEFPLN